VIGIAQFLPCLAAEIGGGEIEVNRCKVLLQPMKFRRPGDRHNRGHLSESNLVFSSILPVKKPAPSGLNGTKSMPNSSSAGNIRAR
jgi:hypothetical protein